MSGIEDIRYFTEARVREIVREELGASQLAETLASKQRWEVETGFQASLDKMVCKTCGVVHVLNKWGAPDCPVEKWRKIAERLYSVASRYVQPHDMHPIEESALAAYDEAVKRDQ